MMTMEQAEAALKMIRGKKTVRYGPATPGTDQVEDVAKSAYERDRAEFARACEAAGKTCRHRHWDALEEPFKRDWRRAAIDGIDVTVYP